MVHFLKTLGFESIGAVSRRLAMIALVALALCGSCYAIVTSSTSDPARKPRFRQLNATSLARLPGELALQLALIAGAAVVGRKVFRLRLS